MSDFVAYASGFAAGYADCPPLPPPTRTVRVFGGETRDSLQRTADHADWSRGWSDGKERANTEMKLVSGHSFRALAERAIPFLRDEGLKYDDDGSNEPLELAREIESALASSPSDESALGPANSAFDGGLEASND